MADLKITDITAGFSLMALLVIAVVSVFAVGLVQRFFMPMFNTIRGINSTGTR